MSLIGMEVTVASSTDPTKVGRKGVVLTETSKTLSLGSGGRAIRVEKRGGAFVVSGSEEVILGDDISGRPEERLGGRKR